MKSKKIKNPLIKRIPKELAGDWKKYLVVFLFLVLTIGFVSGMYVANESMLTAADEGITRYKQEDGHFELKEKADSSLIEAIESGEKADIPGLAEENTADGDNDDSEENGKSDDDLDNSKKTSVTVYENFFRNEDEDNDNDGKSDGTIRVYAKTDDINLACLLDGDFPQN